MSKPSKNHETLAENLSVIERIKSALRAQSVNDAAFATLYRCDCLEWIAQECSQEDYSRIKKRLVQIQGFNLETFENLVAQYAAPEVTMLHDDFSPFDVLHYLENRLGAVNTALNFKMRRYEQGIQSKQFYQERLAECERRLHIDGAEIEAYINLRNQLYLKIDALTFNKGGAYL